MTLSARRLLPGILTQPELALALPPADWDRLLRQARHAGLLARLQAILAGQGILEHAPTQARDHLESARLVAERLAQAVRWEVRLIQQALSDTGIPVLLLK